MNANCLLFLNDEYCISFETNAITYFILVRQHPTSLANIFKKSLLEWQFVCIEQGLHMFSVMLVSSPRKNTTRKNGLEFELNKKEFQCRDVCRDLNLEKGKPVQKSVLKYRSDKMEILGGYIKGGFFALSPRSPSRIIHQLIAQVKIRIKN